jgi:hypothetical protein|tara:strand:- start:433 stop:597 length:165 start_codon:yes stop_codon:yes gene_type:complete
LEKQIKILTLQDCSGEKFPNNKHRLLGYKNPVKYYGKKISKSRAQISKENKEEI